MQLLLATKNKGKLREMARALHGLGFHFMTLDRFPDLPEANESGRTFSENALLKARHYHELTLLPCLADDSGLAVDALGGQPGIHSARYAPSDEKRIHKLLLRLRQARKTPSVGRQARFICCLCLFSSHLHIETEGVVDGEIASEPRGRGGFGYDPVFYYPPLQKTFAQLSLAQKNKLSHRALALKQLHQRLSQPPTSE